METLSKFFFKSITILATTFTTYSFLNWLFPVSDYMFIFNYLAQSYIFIGVTLGIIIAWYLVEEFVNADDLRSVSHVAIIVAISTYAPVAFSAQDFFKDRAATQANVLPYDRVKHEAEKTKLEVLQTKELNELEHVLSSLAAFEGMKSQFIYTRTYELNSMKFKTTAFKKRAWGTNKYKEYEKLISGHNSAKSLALFEYSKELKRLRAKVKTEKASSVYDSAFKKQTLKVKKLSIETYNKKVSQVTAHILPIWAFIVIFILIGYSIEMLSALPLIIKKRIEHQQAKKVPVQKTETEVVEVENIPLLPAPLNNTNIMPLTEYNLLKERYRGIKVGGYLNAKSTLPFKIDAKFNNMMSSLNKKLKEGGFIKGKTHHEVLKPILEAVAYIQQNKASA